MTPLSSQHVVRRRIASRQTLYSLVAVAFALMVALGAAQVSGAHFNDPNYSPGEVPTFDDMTEEQAQEKARDVTKYVEDLNNDIDTAERDGDITHERASEIRADVNRKVGEAKRNYANRKTRSGGDGNGNGNGQGGGNGNGQGKGNGNGQGNGKPANGNGAGAPPAPGGKPGTGPRTNKPDSGGGPGGRTPAGSPPGDPAPGGSAPGGVPGLTQQASGASGIGVAGVFAVSGGSSGDKPQEGGGGMTSAQRLQALLNGTATDNVGVEVSNNAQLRRLLTQATTGVPIGYQALLMALLFVVALLLALVLRERRRAQHVERVSQLDYLTGLANREGFDRMLGIEWRRAMRYGHTLGMVFIDLDDFKRFNDSNGHLAGDRLLREVAAVINSEARASDYTARLGGDEFVILCPETDAKGLEALACRLEDASVGLAVSLSIGFTHQMPTDTTPEDLIGRADSAMYQAKAERGSFPVPGGAGSRTTGD